MATKNKGFTAPSAGALVSKTVRFMMVRDTKPGEPGGAAVYGELDAKGNVIDVKDRTKGGLDAGLVGTLYLRKKHLGGNAPAQIEVTIGIPAAK